jgi:uncharacterized protein YegP (UPF0339 family)
MGDIEIRWAIGFIVFCILLILLVLWLNFMSRKKTDDHRSHEQFVPLASGFSDTVDTNETGAYYEIYKGRGGKTRVRLKAPNHQIIIPTQGLKNRQNALSSIEAIKRHARTNDIRDIRKA